MEEFLDSPSHCFVSDFPSLDQDLQEGFVIRQGNVLERVPKVDLVHDDHKRLDRLCLELWLFNSVCDISGRVSISQAGREENILTTQVNCESLYSVLIVSYGLTHNHQQCKSDWVKMTKTIKQSTGPIMGLSLSQHLR